MTLLKAKVILYSFTQVDLEGNGHCGRGGVSMMFGVEGSIPSEYLLMRTRSSAAHPLIQRAGGGIREALKSLEIEVQLNPEESIDRPSPWPSDSEPWAHSGHGWSYSGCYACSPWSSPSSSSSSSRMFIITKLCMLSSPWRAGGADMRHWVRSFCANFFTCKATN